jgi:peptidyl-dipeptidase A
MHARKILSFVLPALLASCVCKKPGESTTPEPTPVAEPVPVEPTPTPSPEPTPPAEQPPTVEEAQAFVKQVDADLRRLVVAQSKADWERSTNITDENEAKAAKAAGETMTYLAEAIRKSRRFDPILDQLDADTRRQIHLLRIFWLPAPADKAKAEELSKIAPEMEGIYGKGKACDAQGQNCRDLGALEDILASSRDPKVLQAAWEGWHSISRPIKPLYVRFVELANTGAREAGFADVGTMWRSGYDMPPDDFTKEMDRLYEQVKPLYEQLHCYARRQLNKKYGDAVVSKDGLLPIHLTGNMWGQAWSNIYPLVEPYKGMTSPDVTPTLVKQKWDHLKMVKLAESFFMSIGLDALPQTFWERSMFVKPADREVVCHASAWDVEYNDDLRIKMCIKPNQEDLITIHHELGHDYYFHYYYKLPMLYQAGAHDGFHEAIGDTIALSVTPDYLKKVGLLAKVEKNQKALINQQMFVALDKVAFLPFGMIIDKWRWDVFNGKVGPDQYNKHWWELRKQYQGMAPPAARSEEDFDPGAKYHIPGNTPYARYFLSTILQFQFHRALCRASGHKGALHECSIHGSKAAGEKLQALLSMGASRPWYEALEAMTGEKQMDATAILEYFQPLHTWLKEQNKGQKCGW